MLSKLTLIFTQNLLIILWNFFKLFFLIFLAISFILATVNIFKIERFILRF